MLLPAGEALWFSTRKDPIIVSAVGHTSLVFEVLGEVHSSPATIQSPILIPAMNEKVIN